MSTAVRSDGPALEDVTLEQLRELAGNGQATIGRPQPVNGQGLYPDCPHCADQDGEG